MELCPCQPQVFHGTLDLLDSCFAFVWVNTGKANKLLWVALHYGGDIVISQRRESGCGLRIPCQQDPNHIKCCIVGSNVLDVLELDLCTEKTFSRLSIGAEGHLHKFRGGKMDMKINSTRHKQNPPNS